jgi:hypothetical protein
MARPTMLTGARHARIVKLLRHGVPFATACRTVGVSPSTGYDWLYRGLGTHPAPPAAPVYVAFARDVDAVFPSGFAERHEDEGEFVDAQSSGETASGRDRDNGGETVERPFAEPQNRRATGDDAAGFLEFPESGEGFAEVAEPVKSDTQRDRARTREENGQEPRSAPMPWLSQRSRRTSIFDMEF